MKIAQEIQDRLDEMQENDMPQLINKTRVWEHLRTEGALRISGDTLDLMNVLVYVVSENLALTAASLGYNTLTPDVAIRILHTMEPIHLTVGAINIKNISNQAAEHHVRRYIRQQIPIIIKEYLEANREKTVDEMIDTFEVYEFEEEEGGGSDE